MSANAFLATRLSFINVLAEVCEATGADVAALAGALAYDERIGGRFLTPGLGYGGGCLPKDVRAFGVVAEELGVGSLATLLTEVDVINMRCRSRAVELAREVVGGSLEGRRVAVLGVAFKPGSDDVQLRQPGRVRSAGRRGRGSDRPRPGRPAQRGARPA